MRSEAGQMLSHYRLIEKIGEGGMGVVWRAEDTILRREVALKFLPEGFAREPDSLARFEREARLLASLNHPNIAAIHGFEEADRERFLVLELVRGTSLAERLEKGPLPVEEALRVCCEIAMALEAAHEKSVIHRDLKPANVQVTPENQVKVLDFGLAKAFDEASPATEDSQLVTASLRTDEQTIVGTTPYMSPEQASAKELDKRTDIWSFGCTLFEVLTGQRAVAGDSVSSTLAAIHGQEPDWEQLPAETPMTIRKLLRRCLEKDLQRRERDIGDARLEIEEALDELAFRPSGSIPEVTASRRVPSTWKVAVPWVLTVVLLATVAVLWIYRGSDAPESTRAVYSVLPPEGATVLGVAVSPDGRQLVLVAKEASGPSQLWLRPVGSQLSQRLPGTSGALDPFWSPDGRYVGFFADGKLKKLEVPGGPIEELVDASLPRGGTWNREGTIVFAPMGGLSGLYRVAASGGRPVRVTSLDQATGEDSHRFPSFLPDGRHFLYFARNPLDGELTGVWVASLEGDTSQLLNVNSLARYAPSGYLLYRRGGNLLAHPFDADGLEFAGEPVSVADDIGYDPAFSGLVTFSVSETGLLAYEGGGVERSQLLWLDRSGNALGRVGRAANYLNFGLSPDNTKLAVSRTNERTETRDLWQYDLETGRESQFTFNTASDFSPVWSPDATEIVFTSSRAGKHDIYMQSAAGGSEAKLVWKTENYKNVTDWSADGRFVVFEELKPNVDIWLLDLETNQAAPIRETEYHEYFGMLSPDMRWIAYSSNATGIFEVWVERFPISGEPWQVSSGGGFQPTWHPEGKELYYLSPDGKLMAVEIVRSDMTFEVAAPRELFQSGVRMATVAKTDALNHYVVGADGERFLVATQPEARRTVVVIDNWDEPLRR